MHSRRCRTPGVGFAAYAEPRVLVHYEPPETVCETPFASIFPPSMENGDGTRSSRDRKSAGRGASKSSSPDGRGSVVADGSSPLSRSSTVKRQTTSPDSRKATQRARTGLRAVTEGETDDYESGRDSVLSKRQSALPELIEKVVSFRIRLSFLHIPRCSV